MCGLTKFCCCGHMINMVTIVIVEVIVVGKARTELVKYLASQQIIHGQQA